MDGGWVDKIWVIEASARSKIRWRRDSGGCKEEYERVLRSVERCEEM